MPRRADVARRAALARAACGVLRARGLQTSMRALADALGIKRPTLYFYFRDVGAVLEAAIDPQARALGDAVARAREPAHPPAHPIDRLRAVIAAALAFDRDHPELVAGLFQRWAAAGPDTAALLDRERRRVLAVRDALVADLRIGIARKLVKPCEPERIVDVALAFVAGGMVQRVLGITRRDESLEELSDRVLEPLRVRRRRRMRS